jgi:hypothetical protein
MQAIDQSNIIQHRAHSLSFVNDPLNYFNWLPRYLALSSPEATLISSHQEKVTLKGPRGRKSTPYEKQILY